MKFQPFSLILLLIFAFSLSSCSKNKNLSESSEIDSLALLEDENDPENDQINKVLFLFNAATMEVANDPTLLKLINSEVLSRPGCGVPIAKIAKENINFAEKLAEALRVEMKKNPIVELVFSRSEDDLELINALDALLVNRGIEYSTVYYRLDEVDIDLSSESVFSIGEEVLTDETGNDFILGFKLDESEPFFVSEDYAKSEPKGVLTVGVGENSDQGIITTTPPDGGGTIGDPGSGGGCGIEPEMISSIRHQIKHGYRYDRSARSEVQGWTLTYDITKANPKETIKLNFWIDYSPIDIHKNDINVSHIFHETNRVWSGNDTGIRMFWGAWELDWWASSKIVWNPDQLVINASNSNVFLMDFSVEVKMKFSDEWYAYEAGDLHSWFPDCDDTRLLTNEKCMFDLKRDQ